MKNILLLSAMAVAAMATQAQASDHGNCNCAQCGCCCQKVCRLKCEMKPVTTIQYCCKCEDFCLPGPSKCCGWKWVSDCNSFLGKHKEHIWKPTCGRVCKRKVLVQVPVTKQVPVYTCEVVNLCGNCGHAKLDEAATAEARAKQIMPVSAEEPLLLDSETLEVKGKAQLPASAIEVAEPTAGAAPAEAGAPLTKTTFLGRIFGGQSN